MPSVFLHTTTAGHSKDHQGDLQGTATVCVCLKSSDQVLNTSPNTPFLPPTFTLQPWDFSSQHSLGFYFPEYLAKNYMYLYLSTFNLVLCQQPVFFLMRQSQRFFLFFVFSVNCLRVKARPLILPATLISSTCGQMLSGDKHRTSACLARVKFRDSSPAAAGEKSNRFARQQLLLWVSRF